MAEFEFTNKLLKEAIADAEAVRQTAIENAKLSLEEKFTPQFKSMLERNLRAEAEYAEEATELPHEDGEPEGSSEMPADSSEIGSGENKEPSDDAFASADDDMSGEAPADSPADWYDDWSESDFDLDEVIRELEEDVKLLEEEGSEEDKKGDEEDEEDEKDGEDEEDEEKGEYPEGEPAGDEDSDKEIPAKSSESGEEDQKFTLEEFVLMMQEAGFNMGEVAPTAEYVDTPSAPPMEETDLNLEEILLALEAEDAGVQEEQVSEEMASQLQALQEELAEYRKAVNLLRGKLNEVNLLNAKLLYTNKIFRKEGLSNEQKVSIVENFDRATTVREVKMVYAVLAESLIPQKSAKTVKASKKIVAEGLASKATPSTAPKTDAPEVIAENSVAKRLQQLAGIIS